MDADQDFAAGQFQLGELARQLLERRFDQLGVEPAQLTPDPDLGVVKRDRLGQQHCGRF